MTARAELRRRLRDRRCALTRAERSACARRVARHVAATRWFRAGRRIAYYLPYDGELSPLPLMQRAWTLRKTCYLPVLHNARLLFAPYRAGDALVYNRYGILEPACRARHCVSARSLDLILAPLVAFDERGNRLGMGGGFYDHTLAFLNRRAAWRRPRLIGLAYEFQKVAALTRAPWDVPLEGVVTEAGVYQTGAQHVPAHKDG